MNLGNPFWALVAVSAYIFLVISPSAFASLEIRGPVSVVQDSTPYAVGQNQLSGDFSGFYYDIDDDIGTEILTMNIVGDRLEEGSIQYRTESEDKDFDFKEWGNYKVIGFMGEEYFAGYSSEGYLAEISKDNNLLEDGIILKVLKDDSDERVISTSNPLVLDQGYELRIKNVDIDGNKAYLELYKSGNFIDEKVITPSIESAEMVEKTYYFSRSFGDVADVESEIVTIAVHFKNAYRSSDGDAASVDGIFQLSDQPLMIQENDIYGSMTVTNVDQSSIVLDNSERQITLNSDRDIPLMMGISIRTADQEDVKSNPLRFCIYKKITEPGMYESRGKVADAVDGKTFTWNAQDFPGFFYDLDEDLGLEQISIATSLGEDKYKADTGSIVYSTRAQEKTFKEDIWGKYYSIGFMGENYFAGYIEDSSDPAQNSLLAYSSDERNTLAGEKLHKVLIDSDDELMPMASGSVLDLQEGYELLIKGIDVEGRKVHVGLRKDNSDLDEKVIVLDEELGTYFFKIPVASSSGNNIVSIAIHFKNSYHGTEADMATINGIWQISNRPISVMEGMDYDGMTVQSVVSREGEMSIELSNENEIGLNPGRIIKLMGDFYLRMADQDEVDQGEPLRFYIFRQVQAGPEDLEYLNEDYGLKGGIESLQSGLESPVTDGTTETEKESTPGFSGISTLFGLALLVMAGRRWL